MTSRINRLLAEFLPEKYRDEIVGDLVEHCVSNTRMTMELLIAAASLLPSQMRPPGDERMKYMKWIAPLAVLLIAALQAWDSGILAAPPLIGSMVAFAILIGVAGLFIQNEAIRLSIAVVVFALLFLARLMSPVPLRELTIVGIPILLVLVLAPRVNELLKKKDQPPGPGAAA